MMVRLLLNKLSTDGSHHEGMEGVRGMKILVVDDTRIILSVVEAILTQDQHHVFTASDGREGYTAFGKILPDMVITDIEMPWQDGLSMMQSIRLLQPGVATLYMTGNPGPYLERLKEERLTYGAGLLNKPFTRGELLRSVGDLVYKSVLGQPLQPSPAALNPIRNDLASLSSAHFQREGRYESNHHGVAGSIYSDGLRAGGRG
jgi:DNA-binding response OmpR family regulator